MRKIEYSSAFKKDYKQAKRSKYKSSIDQRFGIVLSTVISNTPLEPKYKDHVLIGNWLGYRECHIYPDLLLIYSESGNSIKLARINTHSNIFK
jgi:mRNA interferase YafQ